MSNALLLLAESVPRHTFTPAASSLDTGQNPLASFRLLWGQCTTCVPVDATLAISASLRHVMCTAQNVEGKEGGREGGE